MSRASIRSRSRWLALRAPVLAAALVIPLAFPLLSATSASATAIDPSSAGWCAANGGALAGWLPSSPELPICGPGPAYGGWGGYVNIPGPFGERGTYYNATPGFQCVELAERYLAVVDGLSPVRADGAQVAENYHAAYPRTTLVENGSRAAIGHPPRAGDVLSFSYTSSFSGDGHVAVVVGARVDPSSGDGVVQIAQENVGSREYLRALPLRSWRLVDPSEGGGAEYDYPFAEWLIVPSPLSPWLLAALKRSPHPPGVSRLLTRRAGALINFAPR